MSKKIWGVLALLWVSPLLLAEESVREIELSVPLSGVVQQVLVEQGQSVKKGELLLKLDPRRYQIRLNYAEAALQEVEVEREDAELELTQQLELFERMVTTESDLKQAKRVMAKVQSKIAQRKALRDEAALNLEQTHLKAPVDGVVLKRYAEPGEVVSAHQYPSTLLLIGVK